MAGVQALKSLAVSLLTLPVSTRPKNLNPTPFSKTPPADGARGSCGALAAQSRGIVPVHR